MRFELYLIHRATNSGPESVDRASASTHESHALVLVGLLLPAAQNRDRHDRRPQSAGDERRAEEPRQGARQ